MAMIEVIGQDAIIVFGTSAAQQTGKVPEDSRASLQYAFIQPSGAAGEYLVKYLTRSGVDSG